MSVYAAAERGKEVNRHSTSTKKSAQTPKAKWNASKGGVTEITWDQTKKNDKILSSCAAAHKSATNIQSIVSASEVKEVDGKDESPQITLHHSYGELKKNTANAIETLENVEESYELLLHAHAARKEKQMLIE